MTKNSLEYPKKSNPITTASQYALMQAVAQGAVPRQDVSISQEVAREMIRKTPRRLRSKFAAEVAKMRRNPEGSPAFKAGYKWYHTKLKSMKGGGAIRLDHGADLYLKKMGFEGTLDLPASVLYTPSVRQRYDTAKKMREDFIDGGDLAHNERLRRDNPIMNPSAEELTEKWHGREPKEVIDFEEEEHYDEDGAVLAELEELGILLEDREQTISIEFGEDPPMLVANVATETLEVVGGDQKLEFGEGWDSSGKSEISLGHIYLIAYCTDKHHLEGSNGVPESYEHFFGEEYYKSRGYKVDDYKDSEDFFEDLLEDGIVDDAIEEGYLPTMVYDTVNEKIRLVGGKYTIEDIGLKD